MMWIFKAPRTRFGKWLDQIGISQTDLSRSSGVPITTISSLARGEAKKPTRLTGRKLMKAIREIDPEAKERDFWDV